MIKKLRRRLAVIFTAFTGTVLVAVLAFSLWMAIQQKIYNNQIYFSIASSEVINYLVYGEADASALTAIEEQQHMLIDIQGEYGTMEFTSGWTPKTSPDILFKRADMMMESYAQDGFMVQFATTPLYVSVAGQPSENGDIAEEVAWADTATPTRVALNAFSLVELSAASDTVIKGDYGDRYRCSVMYCIMNDEDYTVTILQDLQGERRDIALLCLWYALMLCMGLALLFGINWFLARMVIKPTAQSVQRQADFVAAASHELRNPLAVIRSSLSAAKTTESPEQAEKYQNAADSEAERMGRLVNDLLLLAGGDSGSWKLNQQPVDIDTLLIETAEQYTPLAKEKERALQLELPSETLGEIKADYGRLRQILGVLLDNALEYAPTGSSVILRAATKRNKIEIEVADSGKGIQDKEKERVFERFYRADQSRTGKDHFGLGLSVAQELAALHGGRLYVKDTPGGGTTFVLSLPKSGNKDAKRSKKS